MRRTIVLAWLAGLGLMTWREVREFRKPVPPGRYLAASGVFAGLALLSEYQPAAGAAAIAAWGFDLAVLLQPGVLPGTATPAQRGSKETANEPAQVSGTTQHATTGG